VARNAEASSTSRTPAYSRHRPPISGWHRHYPARAGARSFDQPPHWCGDSRCCCKPDRFAAGYKHHLLDDCVPNRTAYLPDKLKAHLHKIGKPIVADRAAGTFARDILSRLLIDLSWASSRLEGNTYSRLDTQRLIEFGQVAEGKDAKETQMILNHKEAIEMLVEQSDEVGMSRITLLNLHAVLSENLMADPEASGRLRRRPVEIGRSVYTPPAVPQVIEECFDSIAHKATRIADPFEQAFFLMVHVPYLQPFEDVNKRVSRLAANIPLIKNDLSPSRSSTSRKLRISRERWASTS
jgi:Fic family protein